MYFMVIVALIVLTAMLSLFSTEDNNYSRGSLLSDLEAGNVVTVTITPNQETPTGTLRVTLSDGSDVLVFHARTYREIVGDPLYDPNRHAFAMRIKWENGKPVFDYRNCFR